MSPAGWQRKVAALKHTSVLLSGPSTSTLYLCRYTHTDAHIASFFSHSTPLHKDISFQLTPPHLLVTSEASGAAQWSPCLAVSRDCVTKFSSGKGEKRSWLELLGGDGSGFLRAAGHLLLKAALWASPLSGSRLISGKQVH